MQWWLIGMFPAHVLLQCQCFLLALLTISPTMQWYVLQEDADHQLSK